MTTGPVNYVEIKRTCTVTYRVPINSYALSPDEIREYEMNMSAKDAFAAMSQAVAFVNPSNSAVALAVATLDQSCEVKFFNKAEREAAPPE